MFTSREFAGEGDVRMLVAFAQRALAARWPRTTRWHPGDIVWQTVPLAEAQAAQDIRLWSDDSGLAGYVIFEPPLCFEFDLRPGMPPDAPLAAEMLAWAEQRRRELMATGGPPTPRAYTMLGERTVATSAFESDGERIALLERHGYRRGDRGGVHFARRLDAGTPDVRLPAGMRARHVTDADVEGRIDLHRDAWSVWGPSSATVEAYRRLRAAPEYDEMLDVVIEAPGGQLVSYCIAWIDTGSGVGTFEPVGTRPAFAGRGLARQVMFEAFRRLAARGVHRALVSTASVNERALRLYPSCGFEVVDRDRAFMKEIVAR